MEGIIISALLGYVFYNSIYAGLVLIPLIWFYVKIRYKAYVEKCNRKLLEQFKEGILAVSVSLSAGYSIENAFYEAQKELVVLYGKKERIVFFFRDINKQLSVNKNIEDVLMNFALHTGLEDILCFAEVFRFAKRSGGDIVEIIKNTAGSISEKADVMRDISVMISAKKLEQMIMVIIPLGIILYMRLTSPEMMEVLYGNLLGIGIMTGCLAVYVVAVIISVYITDIKV